MTKTHHALDAFAVETMTQFTQQHQFRGPTEVPGILPSSVGCLPQSSLGVRGTGW